MPQSSKSGPSKKSYKSTKQKARAETRVAANTANDIQTPQGLDAFGAYLQHSRKQRIPFELEMEIAGLSSAELRRLDPADYAETTVRKAKLLPVYATLVNAMQVGSFANDLTESFGDPQPAIFHQAIARAVKSVQERAREAAFAERPDALRFRDAVEHHLRPRRGRPRKRPDEVFAVVLFGLCTEMYAGFRSLRDKHARTSKNTEDLASELAHILIRGLIARFEHELPRKYFTDGSENVRERSRLGLEVFLMSRGRSQDTHDCLETLLGIGRTTLQKRLTDGRYVLKRGR